MITKDTTVKLTAMPKNGKIFIKWNNNETQNPLNLTVNTIINLTDKISAIFDYPQSCPNDELWYTSNDNNIIEPNIISEYDFGANIISNTYTDKGIIKFDDNINKIQYRAFYNKNTLTSITMPNNVTIIEDQAFYGCINLLNVVISPNVTIIKNGAFYACKGLTNITLPFVLTTLEATSFNYCTSLTSIILPASVSSILGNVFSKSGLISITVLNTTPPTASQYLYNNVIDECMIYVPAESVEIYKSAQCWSDRANNITAIIN